MCPQTATNHCVLQTTLESRNWKAVDRIMSSLPTRLPKNCNPAIITTSLEEARATADALVQACDFGTAFESSFTARKALIDIPSVLSWATESLKGFSFEERVVGRIATMLGLLGMGSEGRAAVGCSGAVDQLTMLWGSHQTNVDIVRALVSLCSGHIDNVSRTMRRRGISVAVQVLSDQNNREDITLIEQTLVYIGLCAICTPEVAREEHALVPALLTALEDKLNLRRPHLLRHVLMALGNILDCWTKEGFGYHLDDENRFVDAVLMAWRSLRRSKDIATSSSWALGSMLVREGTQKTALKCRLEEVKALAEPWKTEFKTCAFLYETADQAIREQGTEQAERRGHPSNITRPVDGNSKTPPSLHKHCESNAVGTTLSIAKRKRERGRPSCERPQRETGKSPKKRSRYNLGDQREVDLSPASVWSVHSDDLSSMPPADPCTGKRLSKKPQKKGKNLSIDRAVNSTEIRRSHRRKTPSAKLTSGPERSTKQLQHARPLPVEVIVISSDSEDERRSPKAVQDTCI